MNMQNKIVFLFVILFPGVAFSMRCGLQKRSMHNISLNKLCMSYYATEAKKRKQQNQQIRVQIMVLQSSREFWFKLGDSLGRSLSTPMSIFVSAGLGFQSLSYGSAACIAALALSPTFVCLTRAVHLFNKEQKLQQKLTQLHSDQPD